MVVCRAINERADNAHTVPNCARVWIWKDSEKSSPHARRSCARRNPAPRFASKHDDVASALAPIVSISIQRHAIPVGARLARNRMHRNDEDVRDNRSRAGALLHDSSYARLVVRWRRSHRRSIVRYRIPVGACLRATGGIETMMVFAMTGRAQARSYTAIVTSRSILPCVNF